MSRATEYAEVAAQLESLYRQLVTPRLDHLRQLEAQANALAGRLNSELKGKGGSGRSQDKNLEESQSGKTPEMLAEELAQGLSSAGLDELAELLRRDDDELDSEEQDSEAPGSEGATTGNRTSDDLFSINRLRNMRGRVIRIDRQLQEILRDLILSEISADRNTPVPPEYKELVDRYFRSISEGAAATEVAK
jgi:hypothetical protein